MKTIGWVIAWTQKGPDSGLIGMQFIPGPWNASARALWANLMEDKIVTRARRFRVRG